MPSSRIASVLELGQGSGRDVLVATAIGGTSGYVIMLAAGAMLGGDDFLPFAAFWSAIYFVVGALAGVQHEATRAARPAPEGTVPRTRARNIFVLTAIASTVLVVGSSPLWVNRVFHEQPQELLPPLVAGAIGYLATAVTAGVLGGLGSWRLIAVMTSTDAIARLIAVAIALAFTDDTVVLAWCVATPFGVVGFAAAAVVRRKAHGRYTIDESLKQLAWNASRTVVSGAAMGVLVTGFPALLTGFAPQSEHDLVASIVYVSNLVRSPLIVITMAFQLMLVQRLRDSSRPSATIAKILTVLAVAGAVFTGLGAAIGPWALNTLNAGYSLSVLQIVILVGSAAPSAALFVTGAGLLARGAHGAYVAGWVLAAVIAVVILASADRVMTAVAGAVIVAPAIGLIVHVLALLRSNSHEERSLHLQRD